jgi:hypothetical protein
VKTTSTNLNLGLALKVIGLMFKFRSHWNVSLESESNDQATTAKITTMNHE